MSLESMKRKATRQIRKRDAKLASEGTSAREKAAESTAEHERVLANRSLSAAQQRAANAPTVKAKGDESLKIGDADLEVQNDSGYGTHTEYPGNKCAAEGCEAAFHYKSRLDEHNEMYHGDPNKLFGL
jgi:hypothetical protein